MAITPSTPGEVSPPNTLTPDAAGSVAVPNTLTAESVGAVAIPNTLNAKAVGTVAIPNTLTSEAVGAIAIPNTLTADAVGVIAVPNVLATQSPSALPRTLCPIVSLDFASQLYAQCGAPVAFSDLFTYTRASSATFINRTAKCSGGYDYFVDTALDNVLRFEFDPETDEKLGALIEGASTNLQTRSEEFDDAIWFKSAASVISDDIISPDKSVNADLITNTADNGSVNQSPVLSAGTNYSVSVFAKAGNQSILRITTTGTGFPSATVVEFDLAAKTATLTSGSPTNLIIKEIGNGWFRCSYLSDTTAAGGGTLRLQAGTLNGDSIYLWGAQLENLPFTTSYIKTLGSSVSRSVDDLSLPSVGNFPDSQIMSRLMKFDLISNDSTQRFLNAVASNGGSSFMSVSAGKLRDTHGTGINNSVASVDDGLQHQAIDTSTADLMSIYVDGLFNISFATADFILDTGGVITLGSSTSFMHLSKFSTYDLTLTAQEVSLL